MSTHEIRSVIGAGLAALPWCCIAPAAFAASGVAMAGIGATLQSAMPLFFALSVGLLARAVVLAFVRRQGPAWVRVLVLLSTPAIAAAWAFRFGWLAL